VIDDKSVKQEQSGDEEKFKYLGFNTYLLLVYLVVKLIAFPISRTGVNIAQNLVKNEMIKTDSFTMPDWQLSDIILLIVIFLFQPQASKVFESLDLSTQGVKAKFRDLEVKVDKAKEDMDKRQELQISLLEKQQKEIEKLQRFMYRLLLTKNEIEKLEGLKTNTKNSKIFKFYVTESASSELRRLRDANLIKIKPPYLYISDLEKASNYGKTEKDYIDLTHYCQLTELGDEFLDRLEQIAHKSDLDCSSETIETNVELR